MFNLIKLKEHIKTYFYRNLNELLTSTNKTTITLVKKLISDYNIANDHTIILVKKHVEPKGKYKN